MKTQSAARLSRLNTACHSLLSEAGKCEAWALKSLSAIQRGSDVAESHRKIAAENMARANRLRSKVAAAIAKYRRSK